MKTLNIFIIVTNGKVSVYKIDESNKRFHEYGLSYKYVKSYIIGNDGDESVSCPYMRDCISETVLIDNYENEKVLKYFIKIKNLIINN